MLAVPGHLGFATLKTIIKSGKNVVDISFSNENFLELDILAKDMGVTAAVDAGLAPGIPNFLLGYHDSEMKINSFEYYVGGLPKNPEPPFFYKAPFSPVDVIEEYTRPARMMVNGIIVTKPALSEIEIMNKDHEICTLDQGAKLSIEFTVENGKGYVSSIENS